MSVSLDLARFFRHLQAKRQPPGVNTAQQLATQFHNRFRVLLIEKNSHFQHLFAFPRFAVATGVDTHKAFIPYVPGTFANCPPGSGSVVQARVTGLSKSAVTLDRKVKLDGHLLDTVPFAFLVRVHTLTSVILTDRVDQGHCDWYKTHSTEQSARLREVRRRHLSPETCPKSRQELFNRHHRRRRRWCANGHRHQRALSREIRDSGPLSP